MTKKGKIGSSFEGFLQDEGVHEEAIALAARRALNEQYIENRQIRCIFVQSNFFVDLALLDFEEDHLSSIEDWLKRSFDLYKTAHGNTEKNSKFKKLEPWQCFHDTQNAIDLFYKLRTDSGFSGLFEGRAYIAALAILISETPKTTENFLSIVDATLELAAQLFSNSALRVDRLGLYEEALRNRSPEEKKKEGREKGGRITGELKKKKAEKDYAEMRTWAFEDRKNNGHRGQAKRLVNKFDVGIRTARKIIASTKK